MQDRPSQRRLPPLYSQQAWLVRLRWLAGTAVAAGGLLDELYLNWYARGWAITAVGLVILLYNLGLHLLLRAERPRPPSQHRLRILAWMQILPDLSALTALALWTGGYASPLLSFYVVHMVFASLLLPRAMAFAVAGVAVVMVELALWIDHLNPRTRHDLTIGVGWALTLLATVYLANKITRSLRMSQRRLKSRNRRIQAMARRLRAQQQALLQQEKMVAMGQMAAGVAHEIANPLASMDGLLQLLARQPEKISAENLTRLREQVARINAIVRQLTTFAHPGQGAWEDASLNEVATRALAILSGILVRVRWVWTSGGAG
jgi:signal transduction histidine kinase